MAVKAAAPSYMGTMAASSPVDDAGNSRNRDRSGTSLVMSSRIWSLFFALVVCTGWQPVAVLGLQPIITSVPRPIAGRRHQATTAVKPPEPMPSSRRRNSGPHFAHLDNAVDYPTTRTTTRKKNHKDRQLPAEQMRVQPTRAKAAKPAFVRRRHVTVEPAKKRGPATTESRQPLEALAVVPVATTPPSASGNSAALAIPSYSMIPWDFPLPLIRRTTGADIQMLLKDTLYKFAKTMATYFVLALVCDDVKSFMRMKEPFNLLVLICIWSAIPGMRYDGNREDSSMDMDDLAYLLEE